MALPFFFISHQPTQNKTSTMGNWMQYKDTNYLVSSNGEVKHYKWKRLKSIHSYRKSPYNYVKLTEPKSTISNEYRVDVMVAETFLPNPNLYKFIRHLDGNKRNDNVINLEWTDCLDILPTQEDEIWKDVVGFEGLYKVSNFGNVYSLTKMRVKLGKEVEYQGRMLNQNIDRDGYFKVALFAGELKLYTFVHRVVLEAFKPNVDNKPQVDHIDGNVKNNHVENLRWVTNKENVNNPNTLCHKSPLMKGGRNPMAKPIYSIDIATGLRKDYSCAVDAAEELGCCDIKYISLCCRKMRDNYKGRNWYYK